MMLGMLLAGQKSQLYKVANKNEKVLKSERKEKLEQLRKLKEKKTVQDKFVPPESWKDEEVSFAESEMSK